MERTTIDLDQGQAAELRVAALVQGRSLGDVVREALGEYLARVNVEQGEPRVVEPPKRTPEERAAWRREFEELLDRVHSRIPPDVTPEEIEQDITIASEEVRQERLRRTRDARG